LVHCEYAGEHPACVGECEEQLLVCTGPEAQEIAGCAPNYFQCVAVEDCINDIACIEGWQGNW
jgi:hypothetical protein